MHGTHATKIHETHIDSIRTLPQYLRFALFDGFCVVTVRQICASLWRVMPGLLQVLDEILRGTIWHVFAPFQSLNIIGISCSTTSCGPGIIEQ